MPHFEAITVRIVTTIGVVTVRASVTWDIYTHADWHPPGDNGSGILSWAYTIDGANDKNGQPFQNLTHYRDQIGAGVLKYIQKQLP